MSVAVGFIWTFMFADFGWDCWSVATAWPAWAFAAAGVAYHAGYEDALLDPGRSPPGVIVFFLYGWAGLIFGSPVWAGWFVGRLICSEVLPALGFHYCQSCVLSNPL